MSIETLLRKNRLVSDQVSETQVQIILTELERTISAGVEGAVVEFGCYIGTTSLFIRRFLDMKGVSSHREFHVYDSFEGLPAKSSWDASTTGESFVAGELAASKKMLLREFKKAHLQPPFVHRGWFSELGPSDVPKQIAFAFLDGDFYKSIHDSLKLVTPRMQPGGTIIIDDYAREALPGAARAVHEFFPAEDIRTATNLGILHI